MKFPFLRSIKIHLLILVFISALPALGIIIYSGVDRKNYDMAGAREDALRVMRNLAQDHEHTMASTRQFLMTLAQLPDVQNRNAPACNKIFRALHKENPLYSTILAANAEGMVFASAVPVAPFSIRKRSYFPEILRTKEFAVGEYMIGVASGISVLPCAYPVLDSKGRIKGFVVVGLDLESYDRMFKKTKLPEGSALALSDHKHIRLNRYPDSINYIGKPDLPGMIRHMSARPEEGTFTAVGGDGIRRLYAYKRFYLKDSATPYLFMRVGISEEKALSGARKNLLINVALLCSVLISIMVLAWYLGKFLIVQRLNKLVDATKRLRNGDLTIRTGLDHREDELGQLTEAFDEMAGALERKDLNRMIAEEALRESEAKYRTLIETTRDLIYTTDRKGFLTYLNPTLERAMGYTPDELNGKSFAKILAPEFVDKAKGIFRRAMNGESIPVYETDLIRKDGTRISVEFNVSTLFDKEGKPAGRYGIGRDITYRKQAEKALKESEDKYRGIFENALEGIYQSTPKGRFISANPAFARMLGYDSPEELIGSVTDIGKELYVDPDQRARVIHILDEHCVVQAYEVQLYRKDKSIIWLSLNTRAVKDEKGNLLFIEGMAEDITERKQAEEKILKTLKQLQDAKDMLVQSEKLAAIGRLSAGVGHEILNPLNIISMRMQFLEMTEKLPDKVKEGFVTMFRQIDRIVKITKDLSQFSRISKHDMIKKDINQLIQHINALVMPRLRVEQVALETELPPDLPQTLMEPDRIEQVVLNIINNAVDALEGRENKVIKIISALTRREGMDYLRLTISDNGIGIPGENIDKLFDPFFTTKEAGKGTGLGLHICYTIIQEHGGRIWAENNAEGGASFIIEIPIEEQESEP